MVHATRFEQQPHLGTKQVQPSHGGHEGHSRQHTRPTLFVIAIVVLAMVVIKVVATIIVAVTWSGLGRGRGRDRGLGCGQDHGVFVAVLIALMPLFLFTGAGRFVPVFVHPHSQGMPPPQQWP